MRDNKRSQELIGKVITLAGIYTAVFLILIASLYYHQVGKHKKYKSVSESNRTRYVSVPCQRGEILNSDKNTISKDIPSYSVSIIRRHIDGSKNDSIREFVFDFIASLKNDSNQRYTTRKAIDAIWGRRYTYGAYSEIKIIENIEQKALAYVEERIEELPGVVISTEYKRESIYPKIYTHVAGYVDDITDSKFFENNPNYKETDKIGKTGLEKKYEKELKGVDGYYYIEVNARGQKLRVLRDRDMELPQKGATLYTSLNHTLQEAAYNNFPDSLRGSFVAIEPSTGRVLALYSNPSFDNDLFSLTKRLRNIEWQKLAQNTNRPLQNRAINGKYPPGSTFKPITAITAMEYNNIDPEHNEVNCHGRYKFGNRIYRCWNSYGHGKVNMYKSLEQSCNVYYYSIIQRMGIDNLNKVAENFGLDEKTGIDLPNVSRGMLDSPSRYKERYKHKKGLWIWTPGLMLNAAIGQNGTATPIQLANYVAGFANTKKLFVPTIVDSIVNDNSQRIYARKSEVKKYINFRDSIMNTVREGMRRVIEEPKGSGKVARLKNYKVYGKTGSSQTIKGKKTTALFVGYVEKDYPEIAFACVVEDAGSGGGVAAPIVAKILKHYYKEE